MFRKLIVFLLLGCSVAGVGKGWHWTKDGFSVRRVCAAFPEEKRSFALDVESDAALTQNYRYLGRGHQCYAFISEDKNYVLKLPRLDRYEQPFWLRVCRFPFLEKYRDDFSQDKQKRFRFLMTSFSIAFQDLKEETSLLFLHLGKTNHLNRFVTVRDRVGRTYRIDLDRTAFLLQKRHDLMMPIFEQALQAGDRARAQNILQAFIDVVAARARQGIYNKDPSFLRNFGFDGIKGIQIDVGSFYRPENGDFCFSFRQTMEHVKIWLSEIDSEMANWLSLRVEQIVHGEIE